MPLYFINIHMNMRQLIDVVLSETEQLHEGVEHTPSGYIVYVNPPRATVDSLLQKVSLRGLGDEKNLYFWIADDAVHYTMQRELGLSDTVFAIVLTNQETRNHFDWIRKWHRAPLCYWRASPYKQAITNRKFSRLLGIDQGNVAFMNQSSQVQPSTGT